MSIFNKSYKMNEKENQIFSIVSKMTNHPSTSFLMDPLTDRYFMDNKKLGYFVIVSYNSVKITNHQFYYTNQIIMKFADVLIAKIKLAISKDRQKIEEQMFKNELNLLSDIESNLTINKPRHAEEKVEILTLSRKKPATDYLRWLIGN